MNQPKGGQPPEMPGSQENGPEGAGGQVPTPITPPSDPARPNTVRETLAGLAGAIGSVPDGMATAVLAGANPVTGLYASFAGPLFGGAVTSTAIMVIATTSASALGTAEALGASSSADPEAVLGTLVFLIGVFALIAGLLQLGRYTRFVSHSVMTGFLTGVSLILILSQLGDLVGFSATGTNSVAKAWDTLTHPGEWSMPSLAIGLIALLLAIWLDRTPLGIVGPLIAIVVPSLIVAAWPESGVAVASDTAEIPAGLPMPALPSLGLLSPTLLSSALAITVVILVQSSGVAGQFRNPDGRPSNISRDFLAHGVANVASGLFRGIPVGGSVGQTAFNVLAGGVGRLSVIMSGLWMAVFLIALSGLVGQTAMPTLAALLILAGFQSVRPREVLAVSRTTKAGAVLMGVTLLATLFLPVTTAVGIGVILSALHTLNSSMNDVRVYQLVEEAGKGTKRLAAPQVLPAGSVTVLDVEGNLFYAGARSLEGIMPEVQPGSHPVVVLRMRGRDRVGATLIKVLEWYAGQVRDAGGRMFLSGVDPHVADQIASNGLIGPEDLTVVEATEYLGESTREALAEGTAWLREMPEAAGIP
jgi:sulfate permease, SulP family